MEKQIKETQVTMYWAAHNDSQFVTRTMGGGHESYSFTSFGWNTYCTFDKQICDEIYEAQGNNPNAEKLYDCQYTLSIGDIIQMYGIKYLVIPVGFMKITEEQFGQWCNEEARDRIWFARKLSKLDAPVC